MSKKRNKNIPRTVNEMLGIAPEACSEVMRLTCICNDDVLIQNYGRVYEYTDSCVAFLTKSLLCEVHGEQLTLHGVCTNTIRITGNITHINYMETEL
ncbi:MAG: YabP/YqfC family sporulation protein [Clostridia bacterium]|nr:YabP/YqfC family sporulation protein [Clostridia bacterium]